MNTQRQEAGRKGGLKRAQAFTPEYQREARAKVTPESLSRAGRKGYNVCLERHGHTFATERIAAYRRTHLSSLEKIAQGWLDELGQSYESNVVVGDKRAVIVDFLLPGNLVVECDGKTWHTNGAAPHGEARAGRDQRRDARLIELGCRVLHLSEQEIVDGSGQCKLTDFLTATLMIDGVAR